MTIIEALNYIDVLKPNTYSQTEKVRWLSRLDGRVKKEIIDTHEGGEDVVFSEYTDETPLDTVLLIPHPYDEIYALWLEAQIDYANAEYARYNNSISMFNASYASFENYYNRNHMPKGQCFKFF